jgi:cell division protein DivIC
MAKRKNKKSKRRIMIFGSLSLLVIAYFLFNLCYYSYRILVLKKTKTDLQTELSVLQKNEETLTGDIQKLKDPEYIARYARENYMYSKNGEYIIKVEDDSTADVPENTSFDYRYLIFGSVGCLCLIVIYIFKKKK